MVARPLLTPAAQKPCMCEHGVFTSRTCVHSRTYFASKSFVAVREAFSNAYPDKEVPNKTTVHRLVTIFRDTGSVCLWQVLIERQNSWNHGSADLKQKISCNNGTRLQEFSIAISFVVLCVNRFVCSSYACVLNGTPCTIFILFLPPPSRSSKWVLSKRFPHQNSVACIYLQYVSYVIHNNTRPTWYVKIFRILFIFLWFFVFEDINKLITVESGTYCRHILSQQKLKFNQISFSEVLAYQSSTISCAI
jgi:hypothetical protein